jgi:ankyrin repeat protein
MHTQNTILLFAIVFSLVACTQRVNNEGLRRAAIKGDVDTVKVLLSKGANVNFRSRGWTILMFVARRGHTEVAKILLAHSADSNASGAEGGQFSGATALTIASEHGHVEIVKLLLAHNANVNAKNNHGNTALMYAAEYGHSEIAEVLLQAGADIAQKDKDGETALMIANRRGYAEIVHLIKTDLPEK